MVSLICELSSSDKINVIAILVNAFIGIILVVKISKRVSDNRAMKDFFIGEITQVRDSYRKFASEVVQNKVSARHIISWFQIMNIRLNNLEDIVKDRRWCSKIHTKELNIRFRDLVTGSDEFNEQFNQKVFTISPRLKIDVIKLHGEISMSLLKTVVDINKK